jgi:PAS domain S-box-containing protein
VARLDSFGGDVEDALNRVNVPSYVYDRHGIIRWINPAAKELVGDVRGRQVTSVVAPEETRRARDAFYRRMFAQEDGDASVVVVDEAGNRISVEVSAVCLFRDHHVVGVFGQVSNIAEEAEPPPHPHLTPRQAEVLRLLEHGRSTEQIATELHLSVDTVRNHIRRLFRALHVHSRLEAVAVGRRIHPAETAAG